MFHMTYSRSRPDTIVPYIEKNNIPIMTNAVQRWSESKNDFLDMYYYDTPRIIDSGGYNVLDNYGGQFPWSVETYHNWLQDNDGSFSWAAVMDYACEEKFDNIFSKQKRMEMTIENTVRHFNLDPSYKVVPVLQGRSYEDYIWSYEQLRDYGIPVKHIGLGTVCRISNSSDIVELERKLRENTKIENIHGFGVKINAYKMGATFESADSHAWVYPASNGKKYTFDSNAKELITEPMPNDSLTRTFESFKAYYDYVTYLRRNTSFTCYSCESNFPNLKTSNQDIVKESLNKTVCEECADSLIKQVLAD